ncbi:hypothetical protein V1289_005946 [Bradyrhizobium sp. AZCC 2289]
MFEPKATAPHLDSTIRDVLTVHRPLPVFPGKQTCSGPVSMSQKCQQADIARALLGTIF